MTHPIIFETFIFGLCVLSDYDLNNDLKLFKCTFIVEVRGGDPGSKDAAKSASVGCFIIIIIVITIAIFFQMKPIFTRACGLQKRMFLCIRHDEDTSDHTGDVI